MEETPTPKCPECELRKERLALIKLAAQKYREAREAGLVP